MENTKFSKDFAPGWLTLKGKTTISQIKQKLNPGIMKTLLKKGVSWERGIKDGTACPGLRGAAHRDPTSTCRCDPKGAFSLFRNL